jgi:transcriptional regulator with XRE-family HTH domain
LEEVVMARRKRKAHRVKRVPFPLKDLLRLKGVSQRKLSEASGIALSQLAKIANGTTVPTWSIILQIANSIDADLGELRPQGGAA